MSNLQSPCIVQSTLTITGTPADTFIDMRNWHKGVVFVNGFNIGRYWNVGPQQTLYIPAPLLHKGDNTVEKIISSTSFYVSNVTLNASYSDHDFRAVQSWYADGIL